MIRNSNMRDDYEFNRAMRWMRNQRRFGFPPPRRIREFLIKWKTHILRSMRTADDEAYD